MFSKPYMGLYQEQSQWQKKKKNQLSLPLASLHFQFPFLFFIYITVLSIFLFSSYCSVVVYLLSSVWLYDPMDCNPPGSLSMRFSRQNTGVSCHFLLKEIFPTQGLRCISFMGSLLLTSGFLSAESLEKPTTVCFLLCIQYTIYLIHFNTGEICCRE